MLLISLKGKCSIFYTKFSDLIPSKPIKPDGIGKPAYGDDMRLICDDAARSVQKLVELK